MLLRASNLVAHAGRWAFLAIAAIALGLWIAIPGNLLLFHNFFEHYWAPWAGPFVSWAIHVIAFVGDSFLVLGLTAAICLVALAIRNGLQAYFPRWPLSRQGQCVIWGFGLIFGVWLEIIHPSVVFHGTVHHYAFVYDGYHTLVAGLMVSQLFVTFSWIAYCLIRARVMSRSMWVCLAVVLLSVGIYGMIFVQQPQETHVHTPSFSTTMFGRWQPHLFEKLGTAQQP